MYVVFVIFTGISLAFPTSVFSLTSDDESTEQMTRASASAPPQMTNLKNSEHVAEDAYDGRRLLN